MAQNRQARNMTEGKYVNCSVKFIDRDGEASEDQWLEGVEVSITASWAIFELPDGKSKKFSRKKNMSLQIYPGMSRSEAEAERQHNQVVNSGAESEPAYRGVVILEPTYSNIDKIAAWDSQYYGHLQLRNRGWSDGQIKRLLTIQDALDIDNPHRLPIQKKILTGSRLYLRSRVHEIESLPDWTPSRPPRT